MKTLLKICRKRKDENEVCTSTDVEKENEKEIYCGENSRISISLPTKRPMKGEKEYVLLLELFLKFAAKSTQWFSNVRSMLEDWLFLATLGCLMAIFSLGMDLAIDHLQKCNWPI